MAGCWYEGRLVVAVVVKGFLMGVLMGVCWVGGKNWPYPLLGGARAVVVNGFRTGWGCNSTERYTKRQNVLEVRLTVFLQVPLACLGSMAEGS